MYLLKHEVVESPATLELEHKLPISATEHITLEQLGTKSKTFQILEPDRVFESEATKVGVISGSYVPLEELETIPLDARREDINFFAQRSNIFRYKLSSCGEHAVPDEAARPLSSGLIGQKFEEDSIRCFPHDSSSHFSHENEVLSHIIEHESGSSRSIPELEATGHLQLPVTQSLEMSIIEVHNENMGTHASGQQEYESNGLHLGLIGDATCRLEHIKAQTEEACIDNFEYSMSKSEQGLFIGMHVGLTHSERLPIETIRPVLSPFPDEMSILDSHICESYLDQEEGENQSFGGLSDADNTVVAYDELGRPAVMAFLPPSPAEYTRETHLTDDYENISCAAVTVPVDMDHDNTTGVYESPIVVEAPSCLVPACGSENFAYGFDLVSSDNHISLLPPLDSKDSIIDHKVGLTSNNKQDSSPLALSVGLVAYGSPEE
ncbi:unnamed protein product, partial [Protopolystoma xenopodis]